MGVYECEYEYMCVRVLICEYVCARETQCACLYIILDMKLSMIDDLYGIALSLEMNLKDSIEIQLLLIIYICIF